MAQYWQNKMKIYRVRRNWTTVEILLIIEPWLWYKYEFLLHFCQHSRFPQLQLAFSFYLGCRIVSNRNEMKVTVECVEECDFDINSFFLSFYIWLMLSCTKTVSNIRANRSNCLFRLNLTAQFYIKNIKIYLYKKCIKLIIKAMLRYQLCSPIYTEGICIKWGKKESFYITKGHCTLSPKFSHAFFRFFVFSILS